MCFLKALFYW